ncbi:transposase, partial [Clostridium sp. MT-14]|uniref:transposase n=1 Tax=Clostridium sp. MT-14 TaxID=3348360 RepID=UPI0035F2EBC0
MFTIFTLYEFITCIIHTSFVDFIPFVYYNYTILNLVVKELYYPMNIEYKRNRHSCYSLKYHLVVVTKYRHKCINRDILNRLIEISNNTFNKWNCSIL